VLKAVVLTAANNSATCWGKVFERSRWNILVVGFFFRLELFVSCDLLLKGIFQALSGCFLCSDAGLDIDPLLFDG
jgi:hypothetical protein